VDFLALSVLAICFDFTTGEIMVSDLSDFSSPPFLAGFNLLSLDYSAFLADTLLCLL